MKKEKSLLLFASIIFLTMFFGVSGVLGAATGVDVTITGTRDDYTSDVILRPDSNAGTDDAFDAYDMPAPDSPDDFSKFYPALKPIKGASRII